jgi:hypothetical protein
LTIIEGSYSASEIQLQVFSEEDKIRICISVNHPYLGQGLYPENIPIYLRLITQLKNGKYNSEDSINKEIVSINKTDISSPYNHLTKFFYTYFLIEYLQGDIRLNGSLVHDYYFSLLF